MRHLPFCYDSLLHNLSPASAPDPEAAQGEDGGCEKQLGSLPDWKYKSAFMNGR